MSRRSITIVLTVLFLGLGTAIPALAQNLDERIDAAIELNRTGKSDEAIQNLNDILKDFPANRRAQIDLGVVYVWSAQAEEGIKLLDRFDSKDLPDYALSARGRANRATADYQKAISDYRALLARDRKDPDAFAGLVLSLADGDKANLATPLIVGWQEQNPATYTVTIASAYVFDKTEQYLNALLAYQRALEFDQSSSEAKRGAVLMLEKVGAHSIALKLAKESKSSFSAQELERLHLNLAAAHIRFARTYEPRSSERFRWADLALSELEGQQSMRARIDRLAALHDRRLMNQVIAEYEALVGEGVNLPNYAKDVSATAYLYLQQPEKSETLYREVYQAEPGNVSAGIGLFYALVELEQIDDALAHIEELDKLTPRFQEYRGSKSKHANPDKTSVLNTWATSPLFNNNPAEAQARLENLNDRAGGNAQFQIALAEIYRSRGWPNQANDQAKIAHSTETESVTLKTLLANLDQDLRRFDVAREKSGVLVEAYPEDKQVQRLNRRLEIHNMREMIISFNAANSDGSTFGSSSGDIEARVYSAPFRQNWRSFIDGGFATADFEEGRGQLFNGLIGLDHRSEKVYSEMALGYANGEKDGLKGKLSADYLFDDHWTVGGTAELFSDETPLRAVKNNVKSDSIFLRSSYRVSESLRFDGAIGFSDFDDGNERLSGYLGSTARAYSSAKYVLNLALTVYGSDNSLANAAYYNPEQDFSAALNTENQFLLYRKYDTAFWNDVSFDVGPYWQKNFGTSANYSGSYQHRWQWDGLYELSYGVRLASRVYDGDREIELSGFGRLAVRF